MGITAGMDSKVQEVKFLGIGLPSGLGTALASEGSPANHPDETRQSARAESATCSFAEASGERVHRERSSYAGGG